MATHNKTYQPIQMLTVTAAEQIPAARFVDYNGNLCSADERALGVSEISFDAGDTASVICLGVAIVETTGAITKGSDVTADSNGKAKLATTGAVNGRALDSCSTAGFIRIKLVP